MNREQIREIVWEEMKTNFLPEVQKRMADSLSSILEQNIKEYRLTCEIGRRVVLPRDKRTSVDLRLPIVQTVEKITDNIHGELQEK